MSVTDFNNLNGPLPWEIVKLPSLDHINLGHNALSGTIPPEFGQFSKVLLYDNNLVGTIPVELFNGGGLERSSLKQEGSIDLGRNFLSGTIPTEVGASSLSWLSLYSNNLSGSVPLELMRAESLRWLILFDNDMVCMTNAVFF